MRFTISDKAILTALASRDNIKKGYDIKHDSDPVNKSIKKLKKLKVIYENNEGYLRLSKKKFAEYGVNVDEVIQEFRAQKYVEIAKKKPHVFKLENSTIKDLINTSKRINKELEK